MTSGAEDHVGWAVALAASGDEAAFARIVDAHHADMTRVCFAICGDLDLAEEAVQAAWPIAWRKLGTLQDPGRLRSWLVAIAANEVRQLLRHQRRRTIVEISVPAAHPEAGLDPASRAADLDLANAFSRLSPDDRVAPGPSLRRGLRLDRAGPCDRKVRVGDASATGPTAGPPSIGAHR